MPLCTKIVESCETNAVVGSLNEMHMSRCRLSCACEKLHADVNQRAVTTAAFAHFIQQAATTPPVLNPSFPKTGHVPIKTNCSRLFVLVIGIQIVSNDPHTCDSSLHQPPHQTLSSSTPPIINPAPHQPIHPQPIPSQIAPSPTQHRKRKRKNDKQCKNVNKR